MAHDHPLDPALDQPLDADATTEPADGSKRHAPSRLDRFALRASAWLSEHTTIRIVLAFSGLFIALMPGVVLVLFPDAADTLKGFSYLSVFLVNLASTATVFIPVPVLTAAGQALIATEGKDSAFPWLVGIAGGAGMAVGEITAYYGGYLGAELARGRTFPGPPWLRHGVERALRVVNWLIRKWGMPTLFVLSAIPNPLFEFAGLTAGSVRMPFRQFFVSVTAGKIVRGILLAYYGEDVFHMLPFV